MLGIVLGTGDTEENKMDKTLALTAFSFNSGPLDYI